jgi:DNA polymerase III subunit chi
MTDIHFYHLTRKTLEQVLPELLEKTVEKKWRAVVMASSVERVEALTDYLWTYRPDSFLPHGNAKDSHAAAQPIWLTIDDECPNKAQVLFLTDGAESSRLAEYQRVCEVFDGNDTHALDRARTHWTAYKSGGHTLNYWQQNDKGWSKQAIDS